MPEERMSEYELWNELGNLYFMNGAYNQAVNAYHRSILLESGYGKPYCNLALTYVQQGRYAEAVELYRTSIELLRDNREKAISWNRLGNVYRHLRNYEEALVAFHRADELDPERSDDHEKTAQVLYTSFDEPVRAESISHDLLIPLPQDDPQSMAAMHLNIAAESPAALPEAASQEALAEPIIDVIEPTPADLEVSTLLNWAEDHPDEVPAPDPEPAADVYYFTPDSDPEAPSGLPVTFEAPLDVTDELLLPVQAPENDELRRIETGYRMAYPEGAPTSLGESASTDALPSGELSSEAAVQTHVEVEEQPSRAFIIVEDAIVEDAIAEDPQPEAPVSSAPDPFARMDAEEARKLEIQIAKFKRVVQINPRNAYAWINLGSLYKNARLYREAILAYQQAVAIDPGKASYHYYLGLMYSIEGREEDAMVALQRALELDPEHSLAHATLGGYYRKMGLEELAQDHIGKAMKNIYNSESEYNRACLEAICGNVDRAVDLLRVALENKQTYVDWILRDPDLDSVRDDRRFKQLISDFTR
jgi:tetratricopeptide (TPR) repeat protein